MEKNKKAELHAYAMFALDSACLWTHRHDRREPSDPRMQATQEQ